MFPHYLMASNYNRVAEVLPIDGEATIRVDMPLQSNKPVSVSVVDAEGKPVTGFEAVRSTPARPLAGTKKRTNHESIE